MFTQLFAARPTFGLGSANRVRAPRVHRYKIKASTAMAGRDDFSLETKRRLASRAGYRCSFPGCGVPTVGPSDETTSATTLSGEACHIAAAASGPGARRFDPLMTAEERKSIDNGIWLCNRHSQIVDADESRFTVGLLQHWKRVAEQSARLLQELGISGTLPCQALEWLGLGSNKVEIDGPGSENQLIGEALSDSCVPAIWGGELAHAVRDLLIEVARNAFAHGGATRAILEVTARTVSIHDDGTPFDATTLLQAHGGSGGCAAIRGAPGRSRRSCRDFVRTRQSREHHHSGAGA